MTPCEDNTIETSLRELFPEDYLREQAEKTHVIQRERKVDIIALFWTLVLGFGIGKDRKIADLRRGYIIATGLPAARCAAQAGQWICRPVCVQRTGRSAFYDRFTPACACCLTHADRQALVNFLREAVVFAMRSVCPTAPALVGPLCVFVDLILIDATVIRLHELLKNAYAACRTNHTEAACKLHLVYSVLGKSEQKVKLTCERTRESRVLTISSWVKGRLLLFDLGYFKYALFERISRFGGYFISRLKGLCNPKIIALNVPCRGSPGGTKTQGCFEGFETTDY